MDESQEPIKTPTRPGSKWATGRRRVLPHPPSERPGFHQGALVDRKAAVKAAMRKPRGNHKAASGR